MTVTLMVLRTPVPVDAGVFHALFSHSVVAGYAGVKRALAGTPFAFNGFLDLTRKAGSRTRRSSLHGQWWTLRSS